MSLYDWHDQEVQEESGTIVDCLGWEGARIVEITRTDLGYRFVECCDGYFGATLNQDQMERLIEELRSLAGVKS